MNASRRVYLLLVCCLAGVFSTTMSAQVSLTALGTPIPTQTFDSLATSGTANTWTDNSTLTGWYAQFSATPANPTTYRADAGGSNTGAIYSWGTGVATERAFGSVASGTPGDIYRALRLVNNTGATITSLDVSYVGEQWRQGGCATPPTPCTPTFPVAQQLDFQYQVAAPGTITDANTPGTGWIDHNALDFVSPNPGTTATAAALDGNAAGNRTSLASTITVTITPGQEVWLRWRDINDANNDHGLATDDVNVTPQGAGNAPVVPNCPTPLTTNQGTATSTGVSATDSDGTVTSATITGITPSDPGTITLTGFTPAAGVGGTANATLNVSNTTPAGSYNVSIQWANNDGTPQTANCVVAVTVNPPPVVTFIHTVQGSGAATGMPGATVTVEGIVIGDYQPIPNDVRLNGFFVQEEDTDAAAEGNPATSEGIFVFCSACPTNVAEGQRVQVTGTVSEFNGMTEITATTAGSVVITDAGNNLALVTPTNVDLPIVTPSVDDVYEPLENMLVRFTDTLSISEYFEQARYGRIELYEGGRPRQYTEDNPPNAAGYAAHLDNLNRRRVYLDDDDNVENSPLLLPDGSQFVYHPRANGGLSAIGAQGTDWFRGADSVANLTGVLQWSFSGGPSPDEWRLRPNSLTASSFTVVNPRPLAPPAVGGAIRGASVNVLNYFTTLNVRGADSAAELNRQRARTTNVLCGLNPDVAALMEIENGTAAITDLLNAVNAQCGGTQPYAFVNTGGSLGTDQIRVIIIYRTNVLSPVGSPQVDSDPVHNRPPTAQTFDVVEVGNPAFGQRFTVVANHSKSKGSCPSAGDPNADQNDGQGCWALLRTQQHARIVSWVNTTVVPAAGDPDVLLLGDFNSYEQETSMTASLYSAGYTDLENLFLGPSAYSYLFDGQLGHIDYALASASLTPQITGANVWHINADENPLFDYNDEIDDGAAEQAFEEKPDGSALVPPRVLFDPTATARASDHDPVLLGIFAISDLVITKTDSPDPVTAGNNLTYTITVTNNGPDASTAASWTDNLTDTTFVSLSNVAGWTCTTPAVGATGLITCNNPSFGVGNAVFTLVTAVAPNVPAGNVLSNTAQITDSTTEGNPGDESDTETTTVAASSDLSVSKVDTPDPVNAGQNITYTITVNNPGPSNAAGAALNDALPAGTTFVSLSSPGGWSCTTPAVGTNGNVQCTNPSAGLGNHVFTLTVAVDANVAAGTIITNNAVSSATTDTNIANDTGSATTTVAASANLTITKTDSPDPVNAGNNITYTITLNNAGPSNAASVDVTDTVPANTTFVSMTAPGGWSCTTPAVGGTGLITCSNASVGLGNAVFTMVVNVNQSTADGTNISNTVDVDSTTTDPSTGGESDTETTAVTTSADLSVAKVDTPDPVIAGTNITYTITLNNAGPSNAVNVNLLDAIPANTTFVSLAAPGGWSCTTPAVGGTGNVSCDNANIGLGNQVFTLVVNVNPGTANGTVINNSATASSDTNDSNIGNDTGAATTTVGFGSADVSVTKTDTPDPVSAGSNITYTINVTNAGPSNATTATLADAIPANTTFVSLTAPAGWTCGTPAVGSTGNINCSIPSLDIGTDVFTLVVNVNPATPPATVITNSVTVGSATTDPDPDGTDLTAVATTTVAPGSADVSVTKTDTPDPVNAGSNITYTISVTNAGPTNAAAATLNDTVPANTTFVSLASPAGWSCTTPAVGGTGNINCSNTSMAVGTGVFTLVVNVTAGTAPNTVITNTAVAASATADPDPDPADQTAVATTTVLSPATVSGTKTAAGALTPGSTVTYTITLTNSGPSTQTNNPGDELVDVLPSQLTLISANASSGTALATVATNTVTWNGSIPAGGTVTITIQALIESNVAPGTSITNQATINYDADGNGTNEASATTDDPNTVGGGNPTVFLVGAAANVAGVPALDGFGLAMLAALLAGLGLLITRRT